jgi:hypothetical protein
LTPSTTFAGGGQKKLTAVPTDSVQSLSSSTKTFTAAPRRSLNWCQVRQVVWHVSDSQINFVKDKSEWKGTDIVFEISKKDGKTALRFTHVGLVPAIECYGDCSGAWGFLINESLRSLITAGKGQPNQNK